MEFRGLKEQYECSKESIQKAIERVLWRQDFIEGEETRQLETILSEYIGVSECITCGNGTDALRLVLEAWNLNEMDAVFVPDFTFFATAEAVSQAGAVPIFVDVDPHTFNLDPEALECAVRKVILEGKYHPKAVIAVDLFGLPADYERILTVTKNYGMKLLEDGAQGFGGRIGERRACSFGDAAATSFFPAKPLGCYGDGGAVFTNDQKLADEVRSLKVHGRGRNKYDNIRIGMNSRLDTIQAAILLEKLKLFPKEQDRIQVVAKEYCERLDSKVCVPFIPEGMYSSYAQFTIRCNNKEHRDMIQQSLKMHKIPSHIYYPIPLHEQMAYQRGSVQDISCPVTKKLCETVLSLPIHAYLTMDDIELICSIVRIPDTKKIM